MVISDAADAYALVVDTAALNPSVFRLTRLLRLPRELFLYVIDRATRVLIPYVRASSTIQSLKEST